MSEPAAIPPAARLFAWELSLASKTSGGFKTPFGEYTEQTALLGTLTDMTSADGTPSLLRISDPTGICNAVPDRNNAALMETAAKLEAPSFLYLFGTLRIRTHRGMTTPELLAEYIRPVSRAARNSWIASTAAAAVCRLERLPPSAMRSEYKEKILAALETIQPEQPAVEIPDEDLLSLIETLYEGRAAKKERVIAELQNRGMTARQAADTLLRLMEQGDCYAPKPDIIKIA